MPLFILKIKHTIGSLINLFFLSVTKHRNKNPNFYYKLAEQIDLAAKDFFSSFGYLVVVTSHLTASET